MPQLQILDKAPSFKESLGEQLGQGLSQGITDRLAQFHKDKEISQEEKKFADAGYPSDLARLAAVASKGGETAVIKEFLEMKKRGGGEDIFGEEIKTSTGEPGRTPKEQIARQEKQEARAFERNKNYLQKISDQATNMPKEKVALSQMRGALDEGDFASKRNAIADYLDLDILKNASAQVVNSASKQFLMSSLADLTGRPNQFIEQQITKGLINPQYTDIANELILEGYEGLSKLKEREIEIALQLEEDFTSKGKEVPRNFQKLVRDQLKEDAKEWEDQYEKRVKSLLSGEEIKESITIKEGTTAKNDKGQRIIFKKGKWKPL